MVGTMALVRKSSMRASAGDRRGRHRRRSGMTAFASARAGPDPARRFWVVEAPSRRFNRARLRAAADDGTELSASSRPLARACEPIVTRWRYRPLDFPLQGASPAPWRLPTRRASRLHAGLGGQAAPLVRDLPGVN